MEQNEVLETLWNGQYLCLWTTEIQFNLLERGKGFSSLYKMTLASGMSVLLGTQELFPGNRLFLLCDFGVCFPVFSGTVLMRSLFLVSLSHFYDQGALSSSRLNLMF